MEIVRLSTKPATCPAFIRICFLLLGTGLLFSSCDKNQPGIPAYLTIESASVQTESGQGAPSSNINCLWISANNTNLGVYELPAVVPVLAEGLSNLTLQAGIKQNGISATRLIYPFLLPLELEAELTAKDSLRISPVFKYKAGTVFEWIEDFESGNNFDNMTRSSEAAHQAPHGDNSCGRIQLDRISDSVLRCETISPVNIPLSPNTYVELDYRNPGQAFDFYIEAHNGSDIINTRLLTITPQQNWNKVYLDVSVLIGQLEGADAYYFAIESKIATDSNQTNIFLDNLKVLHF